MTAGASPDISPNAPDSVEIPLRRGVRERGSLVELDKVTSSKEGRLAGNLYAFSHRLRSPPASTADAPSGHAKLRKAPSLERTEVSVRGKPNVSLTGEADSTVVLFTVTKGETLTVTLLKIGLVPV